MANHTFAAPKMAYLLHIDTSGDTGCVAIALDGALICKAVNTESRNHAASINLMIDEIAVEAGITLNDLSGVVVCAGPGSYTGLRIGLATAKGLCYALDIPLLLDNKLTLLAYQAFKKFEKKYQYYIPLLLARDKEYFISVFDNAFVNILPEQHIADADMPAIMEGKEHICFISKEIDDENHRKYANINYVDEDNNIDLSSWIFYAFQQFKCNNTVNLSTAEPFYLKQVYTHK